MPTAWLRLWNDYMHEEYGEIDSDYVFINIWGGQVGRPITRSLVQKLIDRTTAKVGFSFHPHQFRHSYATMALREGVQLEVVSVLLTHASITSTSIYTHLTPEDLRRNLAEVGVLDQVEDML